MLSKLDMPVWLKKMGFSPPAYFAYFAEAGK
jgi:hypothetical protein